LPGLQHFTGSTAFLTATLGMKLEAERFPFRHAARFLRTSHLVRREVIVASKSVSLSGPVDPESTAMQSVAATDDPSSQRLYHGTRADLKPGDLIAPGYTSNYGKKKKATYVYLTATLDAAIWGRSWRSAKVPAESTQWNRPVQLWITPT
jgi:hypothetical protein